MLFWGNNSIHTTGLLLYLQKNEKTSGFLMFSGRLEKDQWHEMG